MSQFVVTAGGIFRASPQIIDYRFDPEECMRSLRAPVSAMFLAAVLCALTATVDLSAQAGTATLSGTIVDEQGAAIPGANVTVTELATGATRIAASSAEGVFRLAGLPAGRYSVDVALDGFQPIKVTDVPLAPAEVRSLERLQLKLGQLSESVTVTADTAVVQTATSTRSVRPADRRARCSGYESQPRLLDVDVDGRHHD
jgi:hypothetical protein